MVGAEQHVSGADVLDEPAQQDRAEHRGVVVQPVGQPARRYPGGVRDRLARPAEVQPAADRRQAAAAVRQAQHQAVPLQHAAEDQPGHRERGLHRVPDDLREVEVALAVRVGYPAGVQQDERPALRQQVPQLVVDPVVELAAGAPAADHDAGHAQLVEAAAGLVGGVRPAQRYRAERHQPVGRRTGVAGQLVVAAPDDPGDEPGVRRGRGEQERRQRHRVVAHPDRVHLGQPGRHVVLRPGQRQHRTRPDPADPRVEHHDIVVRPDLGQPFPAQPPQQRHRHRVRVDVDGSGHGHRLPTLHSGRTRDRRTRPWRAAGIASARGR